MSPIQSEYMASKAEASLHPKMGYESISTCKMITFWGQESIAGESKIVTLHKMIGDAAQPLVLVIFHSLHETCALLYGYATVLSFLSLF